MPENPSKKQIHEFILENFSLPGSDLEFPEAADWSENIRLFDRLTDVKLRNWAKIVHRKWKFLLRKFHSVSTSALCDGCTSSHFSTPHPFVIPGGRFREFYYWDSYWIIAGLLVSEMYETAKGMILNFVSIVNQVGFVPNGSRIYYLNRSQPPMLVSMVSLYLKITEDVSILKDVLPALDKEYLFWDNYRSVFLDDSGRRVDPTQGATSIFKLSQFRVDVVSPRPESLVEDVQLGSRFENITERNRFFSNVATSAESGWDFSSRWFRSVRSDWASSFNRSYLIGNREEWDWQDSCRSEDIQPFFKGYFRMKRRDLRDPMKDLIHLDILNVVPLDLNSIMYYNERILASLHRDYSGNSIMRDFYEKAYRKRFTAMKKFLFDQKSSSWGDYNITSRTLTNKKPTSFDNPDFFYISDFSPLWFFPDAQHGNATTTYSSANDDSFDNNMDREISEIKQNLVKLLYKSFLQDVGANSLNRQLWQNPGGIPISPLPSGQQWDFPNAWAPYQYYMMNTLRKLSQDPSGQIVRNSTHFQQALDIAQKWINTTYCGWKRSGAFFEKYNVERPGYPGSGGEYRVQEGFGWTNAVILMTLDMFPEDLVTPSTCYAQDNSNDDCKIFPRILTM